VRDPALDGVCATPRPLRKFDIAATGVQAL